MVVFLHCPMANRKQFTRKVLHKLKRVKKIPLELSAGMHAGEMTEPLPALQASCWRQDPNLNPLIHAGNITIQGGKELPPWFHFFDLVIAHQIKAKASSEGERRRAACAQ